MIRVFPWLLKRFLLAFAILVAVQLVVNTAGVSLLLSRYADAQLRSLEELALEVLIEPDSYDSESFPYASPFFVYSSDKTLIFSNRGKGRSISDSEIFPVVYQNTVVGYFHASEINFADNQANKVFLISISVLGGISILLSIIIGLMFAFFNSKKIALPVETLRADIHKIRLPARVPERQFGITELTEISADLAEVSSTIIRQDESKKQWMRDLAHDLRTPLAGLRSQLEAYVDGVLEPEPVRLKRNLFEIARLEQLVLSMDELAEIETRRSIEKQQLVTDDFIGQLLMPFELLIKEKGIEIEKSSTVKSFEGDEMLLLRATGNILANSVKYVEPGGKIWIKVSPDEAAGNQKTVIEIGNNGPVIPVSQRDRIFDRLFRGEFARKTSGSGLGLSISKEIVDLHEGEISVCEVNPRGMCFIVKLP
jgi:two-component system sensor histidine kinase BaeS